MEQGWEQAGPDVTLSQSVTLPRSRSPPFRYTALIVIFPQIFTSDDTYVLRCEIQDKFRTVTKVTMSRIKLCKATAPTTLILDRPSSYSYL